MTEQSNDTGVLTVLAKRLTEQRLPRALTLKEKVDRGEVLDDFDISFLETVFNDARAIAPLIDRHPEYRDIAGKMMQLYTDITTKAMENEQARSKGA